MNFVENRFKFTYARFAKICKYWVHVTFICIWILITFFWNQSGNFCCGQMYYHVSFTYPSLIRGTSDIKIKLKVRIVDCWQFWYPVLGIQRSQAETYREPGPVDLSLYEWLLFLWLFWKYIFLHRVGKLRLVIYYRNWDIDYSEA